MLTAHTNGISLAPQAKPTLGPHRAAVVVARPLGVPEYPAPRVGPTPGALDMPAAAPPYDGFAVVSLGLALTGIIPIIAQVVGIGLGVASLRRIRRSIQAGTPRRGKWLAWLGLGLNGAGLVGWLVVIAIFGWLAASVSGSAATLEGVIPR